MSKTWRRPADFSRLYLASIVAYLAAYFLNSVLKVPLFPDLGVCSVAAALIIGEVAYRTHGDIRDRVTGRIWGFWGVWIAFVIFILSISVYLGIAVFVRLVSDSTANEMIGFMVSLAPYFGDGVLAITPGVLVHYKLLRR